MALTDEEIKQLFLVQWTLMQMLKDRGYSIEDSEITMTLGEFIEKYGENMKRKALVTLKAKKNDDNDKVYMYKYKGCLYTYKKLWIIQFGLLVFA